MRTSCSAFLFVVLAIPATLPAQPACPPATLQTAAVANLVPSASSYQVLLRQADGSYTAKEITNAAPYQVLSTFPNFQRQLRTCSMVTPEPEANLIPQGLFVRLPSGEYLRVDTSYPSGSSAENIVATVFDRNLSQVSRTEYVIPVEPGFQEQLTPLVVADFNHDDNPDLVLERCLHQESPFIGCGLEVMLGTGGGGFGPPVAYAISNDFGTTAIAAADINGDGNLDLVVATTPYPPGTVELSVGKISVLLGKGNGSFQSERIALSGPYVAGLAVADLNHDGKLDLVFSTFSANGVSVALGAGDGTFGNPASFPVDLSGGGGPIAVAVGDLNGDGNPDIVVAGLSTGLSILFGDGKGGFPQRRDYSVFDLQSSIILTDFDGDGKTDIVLVDGDPEIMYPSASDDSIVVLFGKGNGEFAAPPISLIPAFGPSNSSIGVASADFDGDGILDLVVSGEDFGISVLKGVGDGTFTTVKQYGDLPGSPAALAIADFNHDGKLDFAVVFTRTDVGSVQIFFGNGDGTFQTPIRTPVAAWANNLAAGDFNGDGIADLAVVAGSPLSASGNSLQVLLGNGDGTFRQPLGGGEYMAGPGVSGVITADFNGDGHLDLAIANNGAEESGSVTGGNVTILLGKGDGRFEPEAILPLVPTYGNSLAAGDFNRDGKLDLAVAQIDNIAVLPGHGDGTFGPAVTYPAGYANIIAVDFNGDNILDLIAGPATDGAGIGGGFLLGNGDGTFQPEVSVNFGTGLAAGDFNHDGKLDFTTGGVAALLNVSGSQSLAVVSAASFLTGPVAPESLATAFGSNLASARAGTQSLPPILGK